VCLPGELLYVTSVSDGEPFMTVSVRVLLPGDPLPTGWFQGLQAITGGFSADDAVEPGTPSKRLKGKQSVGDSPGSSAMVIDLEGSPSTPARRRCTRKTSVVNTVPEDATSASQQGAAKKPRRNPPAAQAAGPRAALRDKAARESEGADLSGLSVPDTAAASQQHKRPVKKLRQQGPAPKAAGAGVEPEAGATHARADLMPTTPGIVVEDDAGSLPPRKKGRVQPARGSAKAEPAPVRRSERIANASGRQVGENRT